MSDKRNSMEVYLRLLTHCPLKVPSEMHYQTVVCLAHGSSGARLSNPILVLCFRSSWYFIISRSEQSNLSEQITVLLIQNIWTLLCQTLFTMLCICFELHNTILIIIRKGQFSISQKPILTLPHQTYLTLTSPNLS